MTLFFVYKAMYNKIRRLKMSSQMVRKQIYIQWRQDSMLKHLSQALGLSEAMMRKSRPLPG